jgi:hypothetical protein
MHIEFLVEELSAEVAVHSLIPKIVGTDVTYAVHVYQGKLDLMNRLLARLKGYGSWLPEDWRIVVLVERDDDECHELKQRLELAAQGAGLATKSQVAVGTRFMVLNRMAIEELEAWFFGDVRALHAAYPGVPATLDRQAKYRQPDSIAGGAAEALERVLQRAGYHSGGLQKTTAARDISCHMDPQRNTSRSFRVFRDGLRALVDS